MKDFIEVEKEEVLSMVAEGIEIRAIILSDAETLTRGMSSAMKEQIIRLTTSRSIQDIIDVTKQENAVFYMVKPVATSQQEGEI